MTVRFRRRGAPGSLGRALALSCVALGPFVLLASGCGSVLGIGEVDPAQGSEGSEGFGGSGAAGGAGPMGAGTAGVSGNGLQGEGGRVGVAGSASGSGSGGASGASPDGGSGGSGEAGEAGEAGAGGGGPGGGGLGGSGGSGCPQDTFEPNEAIGEAKGLGAIDSCVGGKQVNAILSGADDEDWFSAQGKVGVCLRAEPKASVVAGGPAQLFDYLKPTSALSIGCSTGSVDESVPGFKGCCAEDFVAFIYEGTLSDPPANILLRVSPRASFGVCFAYTLAYDF